MKQLWIGLAACALIATSCTKNEIAEINQENPNVIGFSATTGKTGKAVTSTIGTLIGDANGFGVFATNNDGTNQVKFIDNAAYYYDGTKWGWKTTATNWPTDIASYPINFYASYPIQSLSDANLTASITVHDDIESQLDYMAAKQSATAKPLNGLVALDFKHILSKIDFNVVPGSGLTVYVQSIEVVNLAGSRTFDYGGMAWGTEPTTFDKGYRYSFRASGQELLGEATEKVAQAIDATGGSTHSLMLIPQDASARAWDGTMANFGTEAALVVVYRIEDAAGKDVIGYGEAGDHRDYVAGPYPADKPLFVKAAYSLPTVWNMSKAYTYTIYLGTADATNGTLVEENFVDKDGVDSGLRVIDPNTKDAIDEGDLITPLNNEIGFTVSVTDWNTDAPAGNQTIKN